MTKNIGHLYVVATPIGNLDDISLRAVATLKQVSCIAAEDTRHTGKLLQHLGIQSRLFSLHDHNEKQRSTAIIERCLAGEDVALVSDAGTPLISDPGYTLVRQCRDAGIRVIPVPGPCALIAALSAAGLPTDKFHFIGFLAPKSQQRQNQLASIPKGVGTIVCYETARRILDTLQDTAVVLGADRPLVLAKELTKTFEHLEAGTAADISAWLQEDPQRCQGEMVLLIAPEIKEDTEISDGAKNTLKLLLAELPVKKAAAITAQIHNEKKNALYKLALQFSGESE